MDADLLIVGAGCAGLSLAIHLLEAGASNLEIVLVDQARGARARSNLVLLVRVSTIRSRRPSDSHGTGGGSSPPRARWSAGHGRWRIAASRPTPSTHWPWSALSEARTSVSCAGVSVEGFRQIDGGLAGPDERRRDHGQAGVRQPPSRSRAGPERRNSLAAAFRRARGSRRTVRCSTPPSPR